MDTKIILDYLRELSQNNNRDWYAKHKREFQEANQEFLGVVEALMLELGKEEPQLLAYQPKELTFKLVRDTRFSKDKSPYNPSFRAHISSKGKLPIPVGYFLVLTPGASFLGGGLFADMFKDATDMVRSYIADNGQEWEELINSPDFAGRFQVKGNALKNVPRGYDSNHPQAEYLKNKSWYLEYPVTDELVAESDKFLKTAAETFRAMRPFNDFLNRALAGFEMPKRP